MHLKSLNLLISRINQALRLKQIQFSTPFSFDALKLLFCLKNNCLIYGYSVDKDNRNISVFLMYYSNLPVFRHLFIYSSKKRVFQISSVEVKKFENRHSARLSPILILDSNQGYITHLDALQANIGGLLFGRVLL